LAARAADDSVSRDRDSLLLLVRGREHGHELAGAQPRRVLFKRKLDGDRLVAVGKPRTAIRQI
jgi:hypothetical protein